MGSHAVLALVAVIIAGQALTVFAVKWTRRPSSKTRDR